MDGIELQIGLSNHCLTMSSNEISSESKPWLWASELAHRWCVGQPSLHNNPVCPLYLRDEDGLIGNTPSAA